jgi:deoxyhypusine synthase
MAMRAKHTGAVILGGGVVKHHIMNANLMRNGTDHCVYINTGQEVCAIDSVECVINAFSFCRLVAFDVSSFCSVLCILN